MNNVKVVATKRTTLRLIVAWCIVSVPAAWGISQTVQKSLALFRAAPPPAVAAPVPGPTSSH